MATASAGAPQPSGFAQLLGGLNSAFSDPSSAGLLGFAQGLLQAGAPHMMTPVSPGQALSMGLQGSQQYQSEALQNAMSRLALPMQGMKVAAFRQAWQTLADPKANASDKATAKALLANMLSPGMGGAILANSPAVQGAKEKAISQNKPTILPANARAFGPMGALSAGAQGGLPEGTAQSAPPGTPGAAPMGSLDLSFLPGAPQAITANAANQAGGAAAATYPYQAGLSYHTRAPGAAGATLGPPPPASFTPVGGAPQQPQQPPINPAVIAALRARLAQARSAQPTGAPQMGAPPMGAPSGAPPQPSPATLQAAQAAARQRQIGTLQGISQAAQTAGVPTPFAPTPIPPAMQTAPAPRPPMGAPLPAARPVLGLAPPQQPAAANGLTSPGLSPAQVELQKQAAAQTGAQETEGTKETEAAQAQLARLTEMQNALTQIPVGGNFAHIYAGVGDALNYAGIKMPGLTAIQEYTKYRTNFVADAARKMGSRISYQEVSYIAKGVPDFTLTGNAPKALLAQLSGGAQYDIARNQAMQYYQTQVPNLYGKAYQGTTRGFEQWWQKTGVTPGAFMFMNTMFALPPGDRSQYLQNFRSTTTGKVYLQQYAKAQAFLRQNPGLAPFWSAQQ